MESVPEYTLMSEIFPTNGSATVFIIWAANLPWIRSHGSPVFAFTEARGFAVSAVGI